MKAVTLELGGKSPTIIFDDADLEQAIKWASMGTLYVFSQSTCCISGINVSYLSFNMGMLHNTSNSEARGLRHF
jgi:hypothetical protein